jgi:hypothetical protein
VRSVLGVLSGDVECWSFGVRHDDSQISSGGGYFELYEVTEAEFPLLKCGYEPPDFRNSTRVRPLRFHVGYHDRHGRQRLQGERARGHCHRHCLLWKTEPRTFLFEFHHALVLDERPGGTQGYLALSWYDTKTDPCDKVKTHFRAAFSTDQGQHFQPLAEPLSPGESDGTGITDQRLYGDYIGIRFDQGVIYSAWSGNPPGGDNPDGKAEVFSFPVGVEICDDEVDNDGDDLVDCDDPDCCGELCPPSSVCPEVCDDEVDNDGDDLIDCDDPDCQPSCLCPEICDDEIDNDDDGLVDCADPDCVAECP